MKLRKRVNLVKVAAERIMVVNMITKFKTKLQLKLLNKLPRFKSLKHLLVVIQMKFANTAKNVTIRFAIAFIRKRKIKML